MEEKQNVSPGPKRFLGVRVLAILEMIGFLSFMLFVDHYYFFGDRFLSFSPHPFWIIILSVASLYGTLEGLTAVAISVLFLYFNNIPLQHFDESVFDYQFRLIKLPFCWFIAAFFLGRIRDRLDEKNQELENKLHLSQEQNRVITKQYAQLKSVKENIESRLASQENTIANVYQTFHTLETLKPARLLIALEEVVRKVINPKKFSIYAKGQNGFEASICHGWDEGDCYQRRFSLDSPLYIEVGIHHRFICVINRVDEKLLKGQGIVAGPLIDSDTKEVFGMVKIEEMDFDSLNLSSLEAFKALCECIGLAYAQANQYQKEVRKNKNLQVPIETEGVAYERR